MDNIIWQQGHSIYNEISVLVATVNANLVKITLDKLVITEYEYLPLALGEKITLTGNYLLVDEFILYQTTIDKDIYLRADWNRETEEFENKNFTLIGNKNMPSKSNKNWLFLSFLTLPILWIITKN